MSDQADDAIDQADDVLEWIIERGKVAEFARAVQNTSDTYSKPDAVAPPTFPQSMALWRARRTTRPAPGRERLDMRRVLHGEQEFEYVRPLRTGDVLHATTKVKDTYEKEGKRGGKMTFVITETTFRDQEGEVVAYSRGTTIQTTKAATS